MITVSEMKMIQLNAGKDTNLEISLTRCRCSDAASNTMAWQLVIPNLTKSCQVFFFGLQQARKKRLTWSLFLDAQVQNHAHWLNSLSTHHARSHQS